MLTNAHCTKRHNWVPLLILVISNICFTLASEPVITDCYIYGRLDITGDLHVTEYIRILGGAEQSAASRYLYSGYYGYNDAIVDISITAFDEAGTALVLPKANSASNIHKHPNTYYIMKKHNARIITWYVPPSSTAIHKNFTLSYTLRSVVRSLVANYDEVGWKVLTGSHLPIEKLVVSLIPHENNELLVNPEEHTNGFYLNDEPVKTLEGMKESFTSSLVQLNSEMHINALDKITVYAYVRSRVSHVRFAAPKWQVKESRAYLIHYFITIVSIFSPPLALLGLWFFFYQSDNFKPLTRSITSLPYSFLDPNAVGILINGKLSGRSIVAAITHLAVRGVITIEEKSVEGSTSFKFVLKRQMNSRASLELDEQQLLTMIFGQSEEKDLNSWCEWSATEKLENYGKFKDSVMERLVQVKYFTVSPKTFFRQLKSFGFVCWLSVPPLILLAVISSPDIITSWPLFGVCLTLLGIIFIGAEEYLSTKTALGIQVAEDWVQFQNYIQELLSRELTDDYAISYGRVFEEYLPFTVLFGLETGWSMVWERTPSYLKNHAASPSWYKMRQIKKEEDTSLILELTSDNENSTPNAKPEVRFSDAFQQFVEECLRAMEFEENEK